MILEFAAAGDTNIPTLTGNTLIDVISIIGTVALAAIGLFSARGRARVVGKDDPPKPPDAPSPAAQVVVQNTAEQQSIAAYLQRQNEKLDERCQELGRELDRAQELIADLRIEIIRHRATIERLRMGWERP